MKYDDDHIRDFEGAEGTCNVCGLDIILDWQDRPTKLFPMDSVWRVRCPHCDTIVECVHRARAVEHEA